MTGNKLALTVSVILCLMTIESGAQNIGAYFNDSYVFSMELNPAMTPDSSARLLSLPGMMLEAGGSVGLDAALFPSGDGFVTGLHSSVSTSDFMSRISSKPALGADARMRVLGMGFGAGPKDYLSFGLSVRWLGSGAAPKDAFLFLKEGTATKTSFDLSSTAYDVCSFVEAAMGWSHDFGQVKFGSRFKFLYGLKHSVMNFSRLDISASDESWAISGDGAIQTDASGTSAGLALDIGVKAQVGEYVTLSASLLDLGSIYWLREARYSQSGDTWRFDGLEDTIDIADIESKSSIVDEIDYKVQELKAAMLFVRENGGFKSTTALPVSFIAGCEVQMPFWDKMTAGVVLHHKNDQLRPMTDFRTIVDVHPVDWFETSLNMGYSSGGFRRGILAVFCAGPMRLHVGGELNGRSYGRYKLLRVPLENPSILMDCGVSLVF